MLENLQFYLWFRRPTAGQDSARTEEPPMKVAILKKI